MQTSGMEDPDITEEFTPPVSFQNLLLVGTGALGVAFLPYWLSWLKSCYPHVKTRVALTPSAQRFVSIDTLTALTKSDIFIDRWNKRPPIEAPHIVLARWADVVVVHPATVHFTARFALGLADSPILLALQSTHAVVGIAPSFPPGAQENLTLLGHLDALRARPNVVVAPTSPALSATTGETEEGGAAPLSQVFALVEERRRRLTSAHGWKER